MDEFFLSGSKLVKLKLIEQLLSRTQNITSLSSDLDISVQTFKRYLSEIQKDVEQLNYTLPIVFTDAVTCSFRAEKGSIDFDNIAKLRLSYVKTSLPFQICSLFIQSHTPTINDVAEKLYVSTSQIYKSIKKLNTILSLWNISVTVGKHQHLVLSGNELNIRVFLYHFISHFPPMENQRLKHNFSQPIFKDLIYLFPAKDLSTDSLKKLTLIFYILEQRLLKKQFVDPISSTLFTTFEFFSYIPREFIESFLEIKQVFDSNTQYYEYLYLNFFIRLFVPDVVLEENILEKGIRLTHPKDEREQFIFNLQKTWENTFNVHLTKEKQYTLLYTSALLATLIYFSPIDLTQMLKIETLYTKKEQEFSEITLFIDDFLFKSNLSEQDKNLFREKKGVEYFSTLYFLEHTMHTTPRISIYFDFTNNYTAQDFIKSKIQLIYSESVYKFVLSANEADIILTDNLEHTSAKSKNIIFNEFFEIEKLNDILTLFHDYILQGIQK